MSAPLYNIGPDAIADPGTPGGPRFTVARPEWIAIQARCTDVLALPTTADAFRKSLGAGAPEDLAEFAQLIEAYATLQAQVTTWTTTTFPAVVALACDIHQYGTVQAPVYYPGILQEARILERAPHDGQAKAALQAMLDQLWREANENSGRAGQVAAEIARFAADCELAEATLGGDGTGGLVRYYESAYGSSSAEVGELTKEIAEQRAILTSADDAYGHDVVIAATAPTYVWCWPVGTVAATVVYGSYGTARTDALDRARAAQGAIDRLSDQPAAGANLLVALHLAAIAVGTIVRGLTETLPVIQKIQGVWGGIAADLGALSVLVDDDIRTVPPIITGLGVDEAITAWHRIARQADAYRVKAHLVQPPGRHSMAAWKVTNQVSSARTVSTHVMAA
ncbi:MAG TPA: HBL/NHE enterotoxin family protein [Microlunatus sp.]